jgi:hypothetical protein
MSTFDKYRYVIVDYDNITDQMLSDTGMVKEYVLTTNSGVKRGVLKYVVNHKPSSLIGVTSYTHSQILSITSDPDGDWYTAPHVPPDI